MNKLFIQVFKNVIQTFAEDVIEELAQNSEEKERVGKSVSPIIISPFSFSPS